MEKGILSKLKLFKKIFLMCEFFDTFCVCMCV